MIIDPILNSLSGFPSSFPTYAFTTPNLLAHNIVTFFVPSSSGEAALTMPVLAPLGDRVGVNRDSLVLAYQSGNGLLLAGLAIAKIRFSQWFKVIFPFFPMARPLAAFLA